MDRTFWTGKRVFLTGHTGFKGGWLSLWLQDAGAQVYGLALPPDTTPNLFELARVGDGMTVSEFGDIRDLDTVEKAVQAAQPDVLIHMAAQPLVRVALRDPVATCATNVMGTVHVLDAARRCESLQCICSVISDKCYENREWYWAYREEDPMGGKDPYASSKAAADLITRAYDRSYFRARSIPVVAVRAGNVIGGGDWSDHRLIPDFIRAVSTNEPLLIRNPLATRPWQHVLEALHGYVRLMEETARRGTELSGGWNFGPRDEDARPVEYIVNQLCENWDGARWELDKRNHPKEDKFLKVDASKARFELNWSTCLDLDAALRWTIDWYQASHLAAADMQAITLSQIRQYEAEVRS